MLRDGPFEFLGGGGGGGEGWVIFGETVFFFFCRKNRIFFFREVERQDIFFLGQSESRVFFLYNLLPYESSSMVNTYMHLNFSFINLV